MNIVEQKQNWDMENLKVCLGEYTKLKEEQRTDRDSLFITWAEALIAGKIAFNMRETILKGGFGEHGFPKLAVANAGWSKVRVNRWGTSFQLGEKRVKNRIENVIFTERNLTDHMADWFGTALVPVVPPEIRPDDNISNYSVLFEVPEWKIDPVPVDPVLCRRISNDVYIVEGIWDMTALEAFATGL